MNFRKINKINSQKKDNNTCIENCIEDSLELPKDYYFCSKCCKDYYYKSKYYPIRSLKWSIANIIQLQNKN